MRRSPNWLGNSTRSPLPGSEIAGVLARPRSSRRIEAFAAFSKAFGGQAPLTFELFGDDVLRRANAINYGHDQLPTFDLARARYVIAFGADFLGTWNSPVAQNTRTGRCGRAARACAASSCRSSADVADRAPAPTNGCRSSRAPRACSRSVWRT
jgi:hypothetical protein